MAQVQECPISTWGRGVKGGELWGTPRVEVRLGRGTRVPCSPPGVCTVPRDRKESLDREGGGEGWALDVPGTVGKEVPSNPGSCAPLFPLGSLCEVKQVPGDEAGPSGLQGLETSVGVDQGRRKVALRGPRASGGFLLPQRAQRMCRGLGWSVGEEGTGETSPSSGISRPAAPQ